MCASCGNLNHFKQVCRGVTKDAKQDRKAVREQLLSYVGVMMNCGKVQMMI